ncbi:MAG TPA: hypothetical protein VK901_00445 [Nitrospiraceae bacterium]|nr:hypothetical protein [Nitrospiraceae bacterium]
MMKTSRRRGYRQGKVKAVLHHEEQEQAFQALSRDLKRALLRPAQDAA